MTRLRKIGTTEQSAAQLQGERESPTETDMTVNSNSNSNNDNSNSNNNDNSNNDTNTAPVSSPESIKVSTETTDQPPSENTVKITALHDLVAGGVAGSASVVVGHPFDTIKVRQQVNTGSSGISSLYRGLAAPLAAATLVNALVFGSYGMAARIWDQYVGGNNADSSMASTSNATSVDATALSMEHQQRPDNDDQYGGVATATVTDHPDAATTATTTTTAAATPDQVFSHDPFFKAFVCGSFAGLPQCLIMSPVEHLKCRLQVQESSKTPGGPSFKGPVQAAQHIWSSHGLSGLYRGLWCTVLREGPAFGAYFVIYNEVKDYLMKKNMSNTNDRTGWFSSNIGSSILAGGLSGSVTWAIIYPIDVIKTHIQTAPLQTDPAELRVWAVGRRLVRQHGWRHLFRGLGVCILRGFPVNGTIFPVYELTLQQLLRLS